MLCVFSSTVLATELKLGHHEKNTEAIEENSKKLSKLAYSRRIYIKLPLLQPRFHWKFLDKSKLFKNKLTLSFSSIDGAQELEIFEDERLSKNFKSLSCNNNGGNQQYFGFTSKNDFRVSEIDIVNLKFEVYEDLKGIGADSKGVL